MERKSAHQNFSKVCELSGFCWTFRIFVKNFFQKCLISQQIIFQLCHRKYNFYTVLSTVFKTFLKNEVIFGCGLFLIVSFTIFVLIIGSIYQKYVKNITKKWKFLSSVRTFRILHQKVFFRKCANFPDSAGLSSAGLSSHHCIFKKIALYQEL